MRIVEIEKGYITLELLPEDAQRLAAACKEYESNKDSNDERSVLTAGLYRTMASALEVAALAAEHQMGVLRPPDYTPWTLSELSRCIPGVVTHIRGEGEAEPA